MSGPEAGRRLLLLRHGQTSWNRIHRIQGQLDSELDEDGHAQAAAAAAVLADLGPTLLWSSDSRRARQTAAYLEEACGLAATYDARLREYHLGERQGLTHAEYAALAPAEFAEFRRGDFDVAPGGESAVEVAARMTAAVRDALAATEPGGLAVVVSHGAAIRDTVPVLLGWPVGERSALHGLDNCGWVELEEAAPGEPLRMRAYNRAAALVRSPEFASRKGVG